MVCFLIVSSLSYMKRRQCAVYVECAVWWIYYGFVDCPSTLLSLLLFVTSWLDIGWWQILWFTKWSCVHFLWELQIVKHKIILKTKDKPVVQLSSTWLPVSKPTHFQSIYINCKSTIAFSTKSVWENLYLTPHQASLIQCKKTKIKEQMKQPHAFKLLC